MQKDTLLTETEFPLAAYISAPSTQSDTALTRYHDFQKSGLHMKKVSTSDRAFQNTLHSLDRQVDRLMAASTLSPSDLVDQTPIAEGYTPNYEGIYILTPISGVQTRLFDYLDELDPTDTAEVIDIDADGDEDYIYMM